MVGGSFLCGLWQWGAGEHDYRWAIAFQSFIDMPVRRRAIERGVEHFFLDIRRKQGLYIDRIIISVSWNGYLFNAPVFAQVNYCRSTAGCSNWLSDPTFCPNINFVS